MSAKHLSLILPFIGLALIPIGYLHKPFLSTAWLLCAVLNLCALILDVVVLKYWIGAFFTAGIMFLALGYAAQSFIPYSAVYGFLLNFVMLLCACGAGIRASSQEK